MFSLSNIKITVIHGSEKAMTPHSSTLAWKIPWMEEPGRLRSMGSRRVGHDRATSLSLSTSCIGEGNGNPLQWSRLENPRDGGAWWADVYGVTQSRTRLKWLSSSSSHVLAVWPSASCLTTLGLSFSIYKNDRCVAILPPNSTQFMTCEFEETRTVPEIHGKQLNSAWYVL